MTRGWRMYLMLMIVATASFAAAYLLPTFELLQSIAFAPGIAALFATIFVILRDQFAHERQLDLKRREQFFKLGVTSHMAIVAFDRHVAFCDAYIGYVRKIIPKLLAHGPSRQAATFGAELANIRREHAPWVTDEMAAKLKPFENILLAIGTDSALLPNPNPDTEGQMLITKMYDNLADVLGFERPDAEPNKEIAVENIFSYLQTALGIRELTILRQMTIESAMALTENREA